VIPLASWMEYLPAVCLLPPVINYPIPFMILFTPHVFLSIPILFNETNTMASIIYLFSDSFSPCHRRSRYVILLVCFLYIVTKPLFNQFVYSLYITHIIYIIYLGMDMKVLQILKKMEKKVDRIDWVTRFTEFCPWLEMAETDRSRTNDLRKKIFIKLGIDPANATCWVSGMRVPVKVAHILPDSSKKNVMTRLGLESSFRNDVNAVPCNFMVLCYSLEGAFDAMQISFSPPDLLHPETLTLKIWDDACRNNPVENDGTCVVPRSIGDYDGAALNIPTGWVVSKRALSYHTLCCYIYQRYKGNMSEHEPADFSSQLGEGRDKIRKQLAELFKTSIRLDDDAAEEFDDELIDEGDIHEPKIQKARKRCVVM
jgi:hypothetical protein